jgi:GNAT superfamily N-acetyltransferase
MDVVHGYLKDGYWAREIPGEIFVCSIKNSLCFGLYTRGTQIGFARVISDFATHAYLGDVFVLDSFRGLGLGKWLMECVLRDPRLRGLRRWSLVTRDAHGLYSQFGFMPLAAPERWMEIHNPDVYKLKVRESKSRL